MSNVVGATATIVVAVLWWFANTLHGIVCEFASSQFSYLYSSHTSSITANCNIVAVDGISVSNREYTFLRRVVEREEERMEQHQWSVSIALYFVEGPVRVLVLVSAILLLVGFSCWVVGARRDGRRAPARKTHSRVVLCRGGGTLS